MACINVKIKRATDPLLVEIYRLDGLNCLTIRPICKLPTPKPPKPPTGFMFLRTSEKKILRTRDGQPITIKQMAGTNTQYYDLPWTGDEVKEMLSGLVMDEKKEDEEA